MPSASSPRQWDHILESIGASLRQPGGRACLVGLHGSTAGFALTLLAEERAGDAAGLNRRSWLLVTTTDEAAERLYNDLRFYRSLFGLTPDPLVLFPEWETLPYESAAPHIDLIARRMRALHRLTQGARTVLVTSVPALIQRLVPRSAFTVACLELRPGATLEREALTSGLLRLGYRRGSVVEVPGEFSIRGGIVDIYSTAYADPLRIEFLGDTVESVRFFDPASQKSTAQLDRAWVLPARELVRPEESPEAPTPLPPDAEWRGPDVYPQMDTLLDYFTSEPVAALDQPEALAQKAKEFWAEIEEGYLRHGDSAGSDPYPTPDRLFLSWEAVHERIRAWPTLALEPVAAPDA